MQAASERRSHDDDRVPLDALIELAHAGGDEVLEADAVDLSSGGLSLRASFTPPVGARMQCRFACPPRGDRVVADCEVVWSAWEGPQAGAFGVRFLALDTRSATLIRGLLDPENAYVQEVPREQAAPVAPAAPIASLHIDGLGAPIEADVQSDEHDHVLLKQELGFLRLGRGVRVEIEGSAPRRGRIASVQLEHSVSEVPALSLGVLIDPPQAEMERSPRSDEPPSGEQLVADELGAKVVQPSLGELAFEEDDGELGPGDTWPQASPFDAMEARQPEVDAVRASMPASPEREFEPAVVEPEPVLELPKRAASRLVSRRAAQVPVAAPAVDAAAPVADPKRATEPVRASTAIAVEAVQGAWERARPSVLQAVAKARAEVTERLPKVRDIILSAWDVCLVWLRAQVGRLKHLVRVQKKRRTTAPAPRAARSTTRRGARAAVQDPPASGRGRLVLVGLLAFGGVAAAIYALAPRRADAPLELHRPVVAVPATAPAPAETEPVVDAELQPGTGLARPAVPAVPTAAGVGEEVDVASPASDAVATGGDPLVFGHADVPNGRTYTLRMSGPIERIEGESRRGGFVVQIPGRLSLDRASPIATSHPALSRSLVLNQGDRAELTIEFVRGKEPRYRVEAKGSTLEVTVERL